MLSAEGRESRPTKPFSESVKLTAAFQDCGFSLNRALAASRDRGSSACFLERDHNGHARLRSISMPAARDGVLARQRTARKAEGPSRKFDADR